MKLDLTPAEIELIREALRSWHCEGVMRWRRDDLLEHIATRQREQHHPRQDSER